MDQATQHHPETRRVPVGKAVKAMLLNGLGVVNHHLSLVPLLFQHNPTHRLIAPGIDAQHLHDDTRGRALDPLYDDGVTALNSLVAVTAAQRVRFTPRLAPLDRPSFHVDGRSNSAEEPDAPVIHLTRGSSRDPRPDLTPVRLDLLGEHPAGIPLLMPPLSGHTSDANACGDVVTAHLARRHSTDGTSSLVAESALDSEGTRQTLAHPGRRWITRVPAPWTEAQRALVQATPTTMIPLRAGDRYQALASTYGGVAPRWLRIDAAPRRPQAPRTVAKPLRHQRTDAVNAFQTLCRPAFACDADARQALNTCAHGLRATAVRAGAVRATPRDHTRGRPGQGLPPAQVVYRIEGALASEIAARAALVAQPSGCLLATNARDDTPLAAQAGLAASTGQQQAERGCRFRNEPRCLASTRYLKQPERLMALWMVMPVCLLVDAALEYRIRQALRAHEATVPNHKGPPIQTPTARWVFQYVVGMQLLIRLGAWPLVLNLHETQARLRHLLGHPYQALYS